LLYLGLALCHELGDELSISFALNTLAWVAQRQQDYARATSLWNESLTLAATLGNSLAVAEALDGAAAVAVALGRPAEATTLLGAIDAMLAGSGVLPLSFNVRESLLKAINIPLISHLSRRDRNRSRVAVRAMMSAKTFGASWSQGQTLPLNQAVDLGLTVLKAAVGFLPKPKRPPRRSSELLSPREKEVAALVASGLSNREVASALFIGERTAEFHVQSILSKLGFHTRAQIAAWAVTQNLVRPPEIFT